VEPVDLMLREVGNVDIGAHRARTGESGQFTEQ
jgi:hypothetical protein